MEKINIKDININSLQRLANQGSKSITYTDGNTCYKVLTGLYTDEKKVLEDKFSKRWIIRGIYNGLFRRL